MSSDQPMLEVRPLTVPERYITTHFILDASSLPTFSPFGGSNEPLIALKELPAIAPPGSAKRIMDVVGHHFRHADALPVEVTIECEGHVEFRAWLSANPEAWFSSLAESE